MLAITLFFPCSPFAFELYSISKTITARNEDRGRQREGGERGSFFTRERAGREEEKWIRESVIAAASRENGNRDEETEETKSWEEETVTKGEIVTFF